jgi:hypothetical protein
MTLFSWFPVGAAVLTLTLAGAGPCGAQYFGIPVLAVKTDLPQPIDLTLQDELLFLLSPEKIYQAQRVKVWVFHGSKEFLKSRKTDAEVTDDCVPYRNWGSANGTINSYLDLNQQRVNRYWFEDRGDGIYRSDTWVLVPVASRFEMDTVLWLHKNFVDTFFDAGIEIRTIPPPNIGTRQDYERQQNANALIQQAAATSTRPVVPVVIPPAVRRVCINREERAEAAPGLLLAMAMPCGETGQQDALLPFEQTLQSNSPSQSLLP